MKEEKKHWEDATALKSTFQDLNFSGDKYWKKCTVIVKGRDKSQNFDVHINVDERCVNSTNFTLGNGEQKTITVSVEKTCVISVTGSLNKAGLFNGASGTVDVICEYDDTEVEKSESVRWEDETGALSCIDNFFLSTPRKWTKCTVLIEGKPNKGTGCMVSFIAGSNLVCKDKNLEDPAGGWTVLNGSEQKLYTFDLDGEKRTLTVGGYITFHPSAGLSGGGARVTLTGIYKD